MRLSILAVFLNNAGSIVLQRRGWSTGDPPHCPVTQGRMPPWPALLLCSAPKDKLLMGKQGFESGASQAFNVTDTCPPGTLARL